MGAWLLITRGAQYGVRVVVEGVWCLLWFIRLPTSVTKAPGLFRKFPTHQNCYHNHKAWSGHVPSIIIIITLADLFNNRYDILTEAYKSWQKYLHLPIWQSYQHNLMIPFVFSVRAALDWTYDEIRCSARLPVMLPFWCYTGQPGCRMTQSPRTNERVLAFLSFINLNIYTLQFCS